MDDAIRELKAQIEEEKEARRARKAAARKERGTVLLTEEQRLKRNAHGRKSYSRHHHKTVARLRAKKAKLIEMFGGTCNDCHGAFSPCVYDFHHLDPTTKDKDLTMSLSWDNILKEVSGCVMLCANCHRVRHYYQGEE